jgi:outer membrane murein-binding lipoprotein Lpp
MGMKQFAQCTVAAGALGIIAVCGILSSNKPEEVASPAVQTTPSQVEPWATTPPAATLEPEQDVQEETGRDEE